MSATEFPSMLVSVEQLREHLDDVRWCVVDVRHDLFDAEAGIRAYREGHIPGAVFANIDTQLSGTKTGFNGRHPLPNRDDLIETFRRGVSTVIRRSLPTMRKAVSLHHASGGSHAGWAILLSRCSMVAGPSG